MLATPIVPIVPTIPIVPIISIVPSIPTIPWIMNHKAEPNLNARKLCMLCTEGALNHDADSVLIHQRVSGPYPAWSRISGHSSIPRVSSVTDFHQSRSFVDIEKIHHLI
jgi:hypothetical protein